MIFQNPIISNENMKIATGSYQGNGGVGSSAKNTLEFDFKPYLVILKSTSAPAVQPLIFMRPMTSVMFQYERYIFDLGFMQMTWGDNSVSWYISSYQTYNTYGSETKTDKTPTAKMQFNVDSYMTTYYYLAIGM